MERKLDQDCGENHCHYCNEILKKENWQSKWDDLHHVDHHYKIIVCNCGKKNWVKVDFDGSGHDPTFQEKLSPLESTVLKVKER